ncbi:MAG: efflux RND transporter periplasmic adaptor subunit [Limisphaerales bacterium]
MFTAMHQFYRPFWLLAAALLAPAVSGQEFKPPPPEGITEPVIDVTLSFPDPGIIAAEHFKEGDFVNTNEVIAQLDSRLEELEVERRRLVMENARSEWEGTRTVYDKSVSVSREVLLKKQADYDVAHVEYQIAVEQLRRRSLFPPRPGIIAEIKLHPGEACVAYQPVIRLVDARQCYFVSNVEAAQSASLKKGQIVKLQVDGAATNSIDGQIVFVSPVVDPASSLQKVRVIFDNVDGRVSPGYSGRMYIR